MNRAVLAPNSHEPQAIDAFVSLAGVQATVFSAVLASFNPCCNHFQAAIVTSGRQAAQQTHDSRSSLVSIALEMGQL